MAMLEAMARGVAPVVTPVGSIADVVIDGHSGLLVPVAAPDRLAAALRRLVEEPELRGRLGAEARRAVSGFGLAGYLDRLVELWSSLAARRRRSVSSSASSKRAARSGR